MDFVVIVTRQEKPRQIIEELHAGKVSQTSNGCDYNIGETHVCFDKDGEVITLVTTMTRGRRNVYE